MSGVAFGSGAANDVAARCEADSFGIDDVVSAVDPPTGGVTLGLAAIPCACEEDGSVSAGRNDNAEPALEGLGLGIGIANSACEEEGSVSAGLNDNAEPAVEGLGLGIRIANAGARRAVLAGAAACCVG
jgi:hypothetical protein